MEDKSSVIFGNAMPKKLVKKASKTNNKYVKKYKKYFTKANAGKKATVK